MNPAAQEFVVNRTQPNMNYKTPVSDRTHAPGNQPTKLSADATPFVPHAPNKPASNQAIAKGDAKPQHVDPSPSPTTDMPAQKNDSVEPSEALPQLSMAESSSNETSPSSPANPKSTSQPNNPITSTEVSVSEPSAASGAATINSQKQSPPTTSDGTQESYWATASAVHWNGSRLPAIFGCSNTKTPPPSQPMCLHSAWDLYADDHTSISTPSTAGALGSGNTGSMPFDPVHIATVADVESFWRLWRYVRPPSSCPIPFTYSWFRKDIKPEWEYPRNKRGGTIIIIIFDRDRPGLNDKQVLDDTFMTTIISCAGETFAECSTTLNGVMLKLRPNKPFTMQLWTSHSELNKLKVFANSLREALSKVMVDTKSLQKLEYYSHHRSQVASNSLASRLKTKPKVSPDYVF
ncbi:unnamed protein product [Phytomonas sp. EM1]|nr:unnamed protein product [Phytomonas sp. EM1]|eukprot:CCW62248.1 unnamed protein product [Phytomonas sp. isolate EM1]